MIEYSDVMRTGLGFKFFGIKLKKTSYKLPNKLSFKPSKAVHLQANYSSNGKKK